MAVNHGRMARLRAAFGWFFAGTTLAYVFVIAALGAIVR